MRPHRKEPRSEVQRRIARQAQRVDCNHFFNLLTSPALLEAVDSLLPEYRERRYPPTVTLAMFLGQVLSADGSCQNAVNGALVGRLAEGLSAGSASSSGYCQARQRLPERLVHQLVGLTGKLLDERVPTDWLWHGRPVKLVDGTTVTLPDTEENQARYPQPGSQGAGVGFPLARVVGVLSLSTGALLASAMGPSRGKGSGEHGLLRQLLGDLSAGDVLLGDRYYCSYFLLADLRRRGVDGVFEQHASRQTDFRRGEALGTRDHVVHWQRPARPAWMSEDVYQRQPAELSVREVKVGGKVLVTTLLDDRQVPKRDLQALYWQRWQVEVDLRNMKTTLGMESLRCLSPAMCEKEMLVYCLAYNLIRLLMAEAALQAGVLPREVSFKHTVQVWLAWSQRQMWNCSEDTQIQLFELIGQVRVKQRPGRIEPRRVKRRPKPYSLLNRPRQELREEIKRYGRPKRQAA
jgi:hypothetical protein